MVHGAAELTMAKKKTTKTEPYIGHLYMPLPKGADPHDYFDAVGKRGNLTVIVKLDGLYIDEDGKWVLDYSVKGWA